MRETGQSNIRPQSGAKPVEAVTAFKKHHQIQHAKGQKQKHDSAKDSAAASNDAITRAEDAAQTGASYVTDTTVNAAKSLHRNHKARAERSRRPGDTGQSPGDTRRGTGLRDSQRLEGSGPGPSDRGRLQAISEHKKRRQRRSVTGTSSESQAGIDGARNIITDGGNGTDNPVSSVFDLGGVQPKAPEVEASYPGINPGEFRQRRGAARFAGKRPQTPALWKGSAKNIGRSAGADAPLTRKARSAVPGARARARHNHMTKKLIEKLQGTTKAAKRGLSLAARLSGAAGKIKAALLSKPALACLASITVLMALAMGAAGGFVSSAYGIFYSPQDITDNTMSLSAVQSKAQAEYNARIQQIEHANPHDSVIYHGNLPDFIEIIAVFAVHTTTRDDGTDVATIDEARAALIIKTFWDMCEVTYNIEVLSQEITLDSGETVTIETRILHINTNGKSYTDMPEFYGFTRQQTELLEELMSQRELLEQLIGQYGWAGVTASIGMSDAELYALALSYGVTLPGVDELSVERRNVLKAAFAGVRINIPYHYDWRSYYGVFPDIESNNFGSEVEKDYKGRNRKGLDCSGFVGFAYYAGGITWSNFGYGESGGTWRFYATPSMRSVTTKITADSLKPGDIGFISDSAAGVSDHTGIYLGTTESGVRMWLHCAGGSGAVCTSYNFSVFYAVSNMDMTFGESKATFTEQETKWLAELIYYEGRGYSSYTRELIAQVAVNRVNSSKFPDTLEAVLKQRGQYGYGTPGLTGTLIFEADITEHPEYSDALWDTCLESARRVANGMSRDENGERWPENVLFQHSYDNRAALGTWFRSYTDASGNYTEHFNYG